LPTSGCVSDVNTRLIWVKARGQKMTWEDAIAGAAACRFAGRSDWRMPSIKALHALINFTGAFRFRAADSTPYLDMRFFDFVYGNESNGERGNGAARVVSNRLSITAGFRYSCAP